MKYSKNKEISCFVGKLISDGWKYHTGGKHGKLISPKGFRIPVPSTPSDYRAFQNFKRDIRRIINYSPI